MKKLNVAIIGCGVVSNIHIDSLISNKENIVAICDIVISKAEDKKHKFSLKCNIYADYLEMFEKEKIDVVHICTPHYLHSQMVIDALNRNINVLCEKPLAINLKELDKIKLAYDKSKAKLGICLQRRFEPVSNKIKEFFANEKILSGNGNLSWCRDAKYYRNDDWRGKKKFEGGGVMINQALHTLDLLIYFMGYPNSVIAYTSNDTLKGVVDVEESAFAIFKFNDGRRFLIEASNANNLSHEISIALRNKDHFVYYLGENLIIDNKQVVIKSKITDAGKKEWGYGHLYLITEFYKCIRDNKDFLIGFEEGSKVVKLVLAMYKSHGKEIKL